MSQDNGSHQPNGGADNTADQMDNDLDLSTVDQERDAEKLRTMLRTTAEQKKHWREKAKGYENDPRFKEPDKKDEKKEPEKPSKDGKKADFDPDAYKEELREELRVEAKYSLSDAELAKAKNLAKAEGKKLSEIMEDDFYQTWLKSSREKKAADNARPDPSQRGGNNGSGYNVSDLEDPKKIREMGTKEYRRLSDLAAQQQKNTRRR